MIYVDSIANPYPVEPMRSAAAQADYDDFLARKAALGGSTMSRRRPDFDLVEGPTPTIDKPPAREPLGEVERRLRVKLTDEEKRDRGAELARRVGAFNDLRRNNKAAAALAKEAEKEAEAGVGELSYDVREGTEERPVLCEEIIDWGKRIVEISRIDTGEVVGTRTITDADRQRTLPA